MRILLTCDPGVPVPPIGYGGIERIVDALVRHLLLKGHTVALICHKDSRCPASELFHWPDVPLVEGRAGLVHGLALARAALRFKPDVVHSFSRLVLLLPLLLMRIPCVMSYQRHVGGRQIGVAARLGGGRLLFTGCSRFIATMGAHHGGNWRAIHNFVEIEKFPFVEHVPSDAPLLFLSRLDDIKGPDIAIQAALRTGRRLILAGNVSREANQKKFFDAEIQPHLGCPQITWVGEVDDNAKIELLKQAAALVVPIRWDEPFGIVFVEALACGVPVISCSKGAVPEIVVSGESGHLIEDLDQCCQAIERINSVDRHLCRKTVESFFTVQTITNHYLNTYDSVVRSS